MGVLVILAGIYGPGLWHLLVALGVAWLVAGFNAAVATTDFEHLDHSSQRQRERRALFLALAPFLLFDVAFHPSFDDRLGPLESAPEAASHSSHRPSSRLRDVATTIWSIVLGVAIFRLAGFISGSVEFFFLLTAFAFMCLNLGGRLFAWFRARSRSSAADPPV